MEEKISNTFLLRLIVDYGLKKEDVLAIVEIAKRKPISFITQLIHAKKIASSQLARLLADEFLLDFLDLDTIDLLRLPLQLIPRRLLQRYQLLPLWQDNEKLGLALVDPSDHNAIEDIRFYTGSKLEIFVVDEKKLNLIFKKLETQENLTKNRLFAENNLIINSNDQATAINISGEPLHDADRDETIISYVNRLLLYAIARNASDVHIEPCQDQVDIRFRIDGLLYLIVSLAKNVLQRIITRLKIMSYLDIAERRLPQDGRFQIHDAKEQKVDCRISTCPTIHGEKLVIRILDSNKMLLKIAKLGMNRIQKHRFIKALASPHGMILVTGPTGSGKTITLYTALNFLKKETRNISTVENPIEIILPGINQVNINPAIGLSFACVLRAFLRQDPDIIMVGEMRDQETAEIGIKAAQTGHLVLSTLHTNSAVESLIRLANMGIPSYNIAASVHLIIAQRLVRRLCRHCKIQEDLPGKILNKLGLDHDKRVNIFSARGCDKCTNGYCGRTGIFEILLLTDEIKKLILRSNDVLEINVMAKKVGMQTLYSSALEKLKQGEISLLEMKRVIKD